MNSKKYGFTGLKQIDELKELEELDKYENQKKSVKKHVLPVRIKKTVKRQIQPKSQDEKADEFREEEIAAYLAGEQDAKREEMEAEQAPRIIYQTEVKEERQKRLIMWSGVVGCMLVVGIFWIINLRETFKQAAADNDNSQTISEWNKTTDELAKQMGELQKNLDEIKAFAASSTEILASSTAIIASSNPIDISAGTSTEAIENASTTLPVLSPAQLDILESKIEDLATTTR